MIISTNNSTVVIGRLEVAKFTYGKPTKSPKEIAVHLTNILSHLVMQNRGTLTSLGIEWNSKTKKYVVNAEREK